LFQSYTFDQAHVGNDSLLLHDVLRKQHKQYGEPSLELEKSVTSATPSRIVFYSSYNAKLKQKQISLSYNL